MIFDVNSVSSKRTTDSNGFLRVSECNITKEQVRPYLGKEIPNWQSFGLESDAIYGVFCPADELIKAAPTFNNLPLTRKHIEVNIDNIPSKDIVGSLGDSCEFESPYLKNSLLVYDRAEIKAIINGRKKELSCGYRYTPVRQQGVFNGQPYDFVMTNIQGNHVALVHAGRAGHDVMVADEELNMIEDKEELDWITVNGNHVPVKKGQSKEEAVKSFIESHKKIDFREPDPTGELQAKAVKRAQAEIKEKNKNIEENGIEGFEEKTKYHEYTDRDGRKHTIYRYGNPDNKDVAIYYDTANGQFYARYKDKETGKFFQTSETYSKENILKELSSLGVKIPNSELYQSWVDNVKENHPDLVDREAESKEEAVKSFIESKQKSSKQEKMSKGTSSKYKSSYIEEIEETIKGNLEKIKEFKEKLKNAKEQSDKDGYQKKIESLEKETQRKRESLDYQQKNIEKDMQGEAKLMKEGNTYAFARYMYAKYPEIREKFKHEDDVYKNAEYNKEDGEFSLYMKEDSADHYFDKEGNFKYSHTYDEEIPSVSEEPQEAGEKVALIEGETRMAEEAKTPEEEVKEKIISDACSKDEDKEEAKEKKADKPAESKEEKKEEEKDFAEGVKYGEEKEKEEPKKLDSEHESEGMKKAEKKKEAEDKCAKDEALAMDIDAIKAEAREAGRQEAIEDFKAREKARKEVRHLIGDVNVFAFDSADEIYKMACEKGGLDCKEISSFKDAFKGLSLAKSKLVADAAPAKSDGNEECFNNIRLG